MDVEPLNIVLVITLVPITVLTVIKILNAVWFRPKKLERLLKKQGVHGNKYRPLIGDMIDFISVMKAQQHKPMELSNDITPHIFPYYKSIMDMYGNRSFVWFGPTPRLNISEPDLIKEILTKPDVFQKPHPDPIADKIVGGLFVLEDEKWAKHRKIVNPAFHLLKLKNMVPAMLLSCSNMVEKLEALIISSSDNSKEVDVLPYLNSLSVETISRTAFGNSHEEGKIISDLQKEEVNLVLQVSTSFFIPGWRYFPTKANKRLDAITKEIESLIRGIIDRREKAKERGEFIDNDLLGSLMGSNSSSKDHVLQESGRLSIKEIIEECKLLYFGGSESTSNLLAWTMVLLGKHTDWQARAREEVFHVFGKQDPNFDGLSQLKTVTMILNEVLRLYPSGPLIVRAPKKSAKLGDMILPAGVELTLLIGLLHHDPEAWGDDVKEFNPQRFSRGIGSAVKNKYSYVPFSSGPRVCIGQDFAMIEAKLAVAMMLQRFSFELSSSYLHAPFSVFTLQPQCGATLVLHKL